MKMLSPTGYLLVIFAGVCLVGLAACESLGEQACTSDRQCRYGRVCLAGVCQEPSRLGPGDAGDASDTTAPDVSSDAGGGGERDGGERDGSVRDVGMADAEGADADTGICMSWHECGDEETCTLDGNGRPRCTPTRQDCSQSIRDAEVCVRQWRCGESGQIEVFRAECEPSDGRWLCQCQYGEGTDFETQVIFEMEGGPRPCSSSANSFHHILNRECGWRVPSTDTVEVGLRRGE